MAKNKTILINRKLFDRIRRMDHCQMSLWAESVYKSGFKDGSAAAEGLTVDEMKTVILGIKGIGEKRAADIAAALSLALENKGKAGGGNEVWRGVSIYYPLRMVQQKRSSM